MTVGDIEQQARLKTLDTYEDNYRFEPIEVFSAIRDGMLFIRHRQPSARYVNGVLVSSGSLFIDIGVDPHNEFDYVPDSFPADIDGHGVESEDEFRTFPLVMENRFREALVYYVIHQLYLKDDPDTVNASLAQAYLAKCMEAL